MGRTKIPRTHNYKSFIFIFSLISFLVMLATISLDLYDTFSVEIISRTPYSSGFFVNIWFNFFHFFTEQNNFFVLIFFFLYLVFLNSKLFDTHKFTAYVTTYISIVGAIFWIVLVPAFFFLAPDTSNSAELGAMIVTIRVLTHAVSPVLMLVFAFYRARIVPLAKEHKIVLKRFMISFWIYPLLYMIYLISINFIKIPKSLLNQSFYDQWTALGQNSFYPSVYGQVSNFNVKCFIPVFDLNGVVLRPTDAFQGKPMNLIWIFASLALMGAIAFGVSKLINKFSIGIKDHVKETMYERYSGK